MFEDITDCENKTLCADYGKVKFGLDFDLFEGDLDKLVKQELIEARDFIARLLSVSEIGRIRNLGVETDSLYFKPGETYFNSGVWLSWYFRAVEVQTKINEEK